MSAHSHFSLRGGRGMRGAVIAGVTAVACCIPLPALAAHGQASAGKVTQTGPVLATPATDTPTLAKTSATQTVRQLVQCGNVMYAVGSFTEIEQGGVTIARNNIFAFSAVTPFTVLPWDPDVNGEVNSIAFNGSDCSNAYIGGQFTSVGGTTVANIAEISASTGAVVPAFEDKVAGGHVDTLLGVDGHIFAGGTYTKINGSANPYMTSLNPLTGQDDGFLNLQISGHYQFHNVKNNGTEVYNQQLSHNGRLELVEGDFTSVGGKARQQIFMLNVAGTSAKVTGWSSPEFDGSKGELPGGYAYQCGDSHPFYVHAAAWSPDDSTVYIADTGFHAWNWDGTFPMPGLCDAAAAFPALQKEVTHDWIANDGCDSLYSVAADASAVYVAGHNRWFPNQNACNSKGPGAIPAQGLAGLAAGASGGSLLTNSDGTAGVYSRSRGHGADDMLLTTAGLWIASDDFGGGTECGGVSGFSGICFLPYPVSGKA